MTEQRLGEVAAQLDADRFVGRQALLDLAGAAMASENSHRIVLLHGPGGVGKSAVLRAIGRLAADAGHPVTQIDGRVVSLTPDALAEALAPASTSVSPVVLVDEADELGPLQFELRRALLETLPASATVVIAGRRAPGREWFDGGLATLATAVAVPPLSNDDSTELLHRCGIDASRQVSEVVAWAQGYPLALTLAASLPDRGEVERPPAQVPATTGPSTDASLDERLLARLGGDELAGVDPDVLDVACIATAVDARLLAAALPGRATREGLAQLRSLSISEPIGPRTTLHRLARAALKARLKGTDPDRYRALVLRIADHLRQRGLTETPVIALELAALVEHPELRVGFEPSTTHYADFLRTSDLDAMAAFTGAGETAWFGRFRQLCADRPHSALAVRRADGSLAAGSFVSMADAVAPWAWDAIEIGPVLRWVEDQGVLAQTAMMHDLVILETEPAAIAEVLRVGNAASVSMGQLRNPRYIYVTSTSQRSDDGTEPLGYRTVPELERSDDERTLVTIMTDFGTEGLLGQLYSMILAEQQAEPPVDSGTDGLAIVEALRSFHDDAAMAASRFAHDHDAASARQAVRAAIVQAFGPSEADQLLRTAIERTYLDPDGGHGVAQRELHMSRSSFYRHLQRARQHLAARVAELS